MKKGSCKQTIQHAVQATRAFCAQHKIATAFVTLAAVGMLSYFLYVAIAGFSAVMESFYYHGLDMFMDYFNPVRDAAQGAAAYTERHVIYPPMANLIMLIFSRFMPAEYLHTGFSGRLLWVQYPSAMFSLFFYIGIPVLLLLLLCYRCLEGSKGLRSAMVFLVLFSFPILYMLERGNILIWSVIALLYYIFYYDSESKVHRELSLIALAFAFSLKLYPALFGWLLIVDKRYQEALRCAAYAVVFLLAPSFFFGGPQCFVWIIQNVTSFSAGHHAIWTLQFFANTRLAWLSDHLFLILFGVLFVVASLCQKQRWKIFVIGAAILYANPASNSIYTWSFFIAPLFLMFRIKSPKALDWLYAAGIALPFVLIPGMDFVGRQYLAMWCLLGLLVLCTVDTVLALRQALHRKKQSD